MLKVGLTVDAAGTQNEFHTFLDLLKDFKIKSTFFVGVRIQPDLLKLIYKNGHEIGNHTYSHLNSLLRLPFEEKELEIKHAHLCLLNTLNKDFKDAKIRGFRVPYYNFDPDIPKILDEINYDWDSSRAYFPILGSPFKTDKYGKILEMPSLFPDDSTMLDRIGLNENQVLKIWKKSYDMSKDTFIWGAHPYMVAKNSDRIKMIKNFIEYIIEKNGSFLRLSEIASDLLHK